MTAWLRSATGTLLDPHARNRSWFAFSYQVLKPVLALARLHRATLSR